MIEWSIKNNMIQQGFTALEETMITYLCNYYGIDDRTEKTREDIVVKTITGIGHICRSLTKFENDRESVKQRLLEKEFQGIDETSKEKTGKLVRTIPSELLTLCERVKHRRNDINHFGFRLDAASVDTLKKELGDFYKCFVKIMETMDSEENG